MPDKIFYYLDLPLKNNEATIEKNIAAVIPPAVPVSPPVRIPIFPFSSTAFRTPSIREYPNPVSGTVAPNPAKSTNGLYNPIAVKITPATT